MVNDNFGHKEGDKVLKAVADILRKSLRKYDIVGRWGGDEFSVGIIDCTYFNDEEHCANCPLFSRMAAEIGKLDELYGVDFGASFGIVKIPKETTDLEEALKIADRRLYVSKRHGKHRIVNEFNEKDFGSSDLYDDRN